MMRTPDIKAIQSALEYLKIDGWLFADFHDREPIAHRVLGLEPKVMSTRRWFYLVPASGNPEKLVHAIEPQRLNSLPGQTMQYAGLEKLKSSLKKLLGQRKRLAMQYSPFGNLPTVSTMDAGTVELIRSLGYEVVSSADLIQMFEARLTPDAIESHRRASVKVQQILKSAIQLIRSRLNRSETVTEFDVQQFLLKEFDDLELTCDGLYPIVATNEHAADPHFEVPSQHSSPLRAGDRLLIDLWAKEKRQNAIYYDITWCYQIGGGGPSGEYARLFAIARKAREAAKELVVKRLSAQKAILGWEVDAAARDVIASQGLGDFFVHRTGHSIHESVHGNGANMDSFETRDERQIIPGSCFSIEPGIYKSPIGVRTEINLVVDLDGKVHSFGDEQTDIVVI